MNVFLAAMAMASPTLAATPPPALGGHVFLGQAEGLGENPAVTPGVGTHENGSVFIVFNAGYASNDARPTDTYGNTWKPLGKPVTYEGYDAFNVKAYYAIGGKGGPEHRVSLDKPGNARGELSLPFVEVMHATRAPQVVQVYAPPSSEVTSGKITVDGPATLLAFWWGDGGVKRMSVTPGDGFTTIDEFTRLPDESGVQGVVAWKQVDTAGTYDVSWKVEPAQGASLWIVAIR
ncbi:hypothetical protein [Luteibacter sp. CQ10]|uniref:hypothetical protein n=1 Tax=Luteibacter sp. CQ10 TaxID=2805821 RepID=UPI0034A3CE55